MSATRQALILVMAKMALADGKISDEEHGFLDSMLAPGESLEALLATAKASTLHDLVAPIEHYADRFFVALRAACIAHIDVDFDAQEETVFAALIEELGITEDDRRLIMEGVRNLDNPDAVPDPRIEKLFNESSFI
jgi:tellurite resistance protein